MIFEQNLTMVSVTDPEEIKFLQGVGAIRIKEDDDMKTFIIHDSIFRRFIKQFDIVSGKGDKIDPDLHHKLWALKRIREGISLNHNDLKSKTFTYYELVNKLST